MYKLLSGAKSVKQYRGDENLPEAKNGMKKGCGCKHSRSKYKYQTGTSNVYIPFTKMSPTQKKQYRVGMQGDSDFDVDNIGKYAKPTQAQKELSAKMDALYKRLEKKNKDLLTNSKPASVSNTQPAVVTVPKVQPNVVISPQAKKDTSNVTPVVPVQATSKQKVTGKYLDPDSKGVLISQKGKSTPVNDKSLSEVTTAQMLKGANEKKASDLYPKTNASINTKFNSKPVPTQNKTKTTPVIKKQKAGKFLDPKSVGVLMSQQGPTPAQKVITPLKEVIYNFPKGKTRKVTQIPVKTEVEEPSIIDTTKKSFNDIINNTKKIINDPIDVKKAIKDSIKENLPDGDIKETILNNPVSSWPSLAISAIRRKWAKENPEEERTTTIKVPDIDSSSIKSSKEKSKVVQRPDVYITGDTLQDKGLDRRYHLPEIIDLDSPNITYGTRNRGEYDEIKTEGAPITSAYPFTSSKQYFANSKDPSHTDYIGIDSKGKIKIGKKNDFQDDDYQLSKTYIQNVESFEGLEQAIGNKNFQSPQVNIITDSGVKMKTNLNFLVPKGNREKAENTFDEVSGGRYIFETPDKSKRILVSGSLKTIKETFNKMKKDNPYLRVISLDNGSYAKGIRTFDQTLTPEDLRTYDAQNPVGGGNIAYIKSRVKKYKYGTGALTIPEGSAIVTAQVDKKTGTIPAKKAIELYKYAKQTNSTKAWKGLNNLIEKMPEDNVDKAQDGRKKLEARYKELGELTGPLSDAQKKEFEDIKSQLTQDEYDIYTDERIAEKFGQKYDVDKAKYRSSLKEGKLKLIENAKNVAYRNRLRNEPAFFQEEMKAGRVTIDKNGNISYKPQGKYSTNAMEFLGTSKKGALPTLQGSPDLLKGPPPDEGNINKDTFAGDKKKGNFLANIPSLAEVAARASILGQGVEGVPENYLNLGRYKYASQLPKTLQEISLAEQGGRETARNMVGGDAGRYLAQAGNLSASRMKAANEAVIQDTLARQDILNRNVDLGNTEAQVNTGLKNQFAQQRAANRGAYNNQLIALGQSIDTATDVSKLMASQRNVDDIRTNLLKSKDYYMDPQGNIRMGKKGIKKVKTYKRK